MLQGANTLRAGLPFFGPIIQLPLLTRLTLCDRYWKHYKANQSITTLSLEGNKIGDDGVSALAEALQAALVVRSQKSAHRFRALDTVHFLVQ